MSLLQINRRLVVMLLGSTSLLACSTPSPKVAEVLSPEQHRIQQKFRGIQGLVLRLDAADPGKEYVTMTTDQGLGFGAAALLNLKNVHNLTYGGGTIQVPISVRVIWRKGPVVFVGGKEMWSGGTTLGDQTIQIADRIPDDLLDEIRAHGGALRIKIRLMDDRVLLGWDIEKRFVTQYGRGIEYVMEGGDFYEGVPKKGGFSRRPWYLNAQGQRVEVEADD